MEQDNGGEGSSTGEADTGNTEIAKQRTLAANDQFESEATPYTTDSFLKLTCMTQLSDDAMSIGACCQLTAASAGSSGDSNRRSKKSEAIDALGDIHDTQMLIDNIFENGDG